MPPKSSLGKGLEALLPDFLDDLGKKPDYLLCGIEELSPNRFQPRRTFADQEQQNLVASIKKSGILQPILARRSDRGYEIIAGERRWRAAQAAGLREVPIVLREVQDVDLAVLSLVENLLREDLNPLEEAAGYQLLVDRFGLSQDDISLRVGRDRSTVANTLRLLKLPPEVKNALVQKTLTAGHARALLALTSPEEQQRLFRQILQRSLSVRETERSVQRLKKPAVAPAAKTDPTLTDLEKTLSRRLATAVHIRRGKTSGTIEIRFTDGEDLDRLYHLLLEEDPFPKRTGPSRSRTA